MHGSTAALSCVSSLRISKEQEDDTGEEETWKKSSKVMEENIGAHHQVIRAMSPNTLSREVANKHLTDGGGTIEVLK